MSKEIFAKILVLGAQGLLGRVVYKYLLYNYSSVFGTSRKKNSGFLFLDVASAEKDFRGIYKKLKKIDYVINCIGSLKNSVSIQELINVNTTFPRLLEKLSQKYNFRLIHISTDGVFSSLSNTVYESDEPYPSGEYELSKFLGETSAKSALTIRTSVIGFNSASQKGLLEWVINKSPDIIEGYFNQQWSGCTTLQFAKLCELLINNNLFGKLRHKTPVIHFAPIKNTTKYKIITSIAKLAKLKKIIKKSKGPEITRIFDSKYKKFLFYESFEHNIEKAIQELMQFEKNIETPYNGLSVKKKKLAFVLGIRPDIIRAVLILRYLEKAKDIDVIFIWSGQHYSDNLKGVFFREFKLRRADYELGCRGDTDVEIAGELIKKLYKLLEKIKPDAVAFLGDTNTTAGCIAPAMLNIPIIHIEGCWHSYDWRMPEEKYRTVSDHLADIIYTYEEEYKKRGIAEGLNPKNIIVTRNPIVDILNEFYFKQKGKFEKMATRIFFKKRGIKKW